MTALQPKSNNLPEMHEQPEQPVPTMMPGDENAAARAGEEMNENLKTADGAAA